MKSAITSTSLLEQYKDDENLKARISIHKYNENKVDWNSWIFNQLNIAENSKILELGCGNGVFWESNMEYIKESWQITLSDFSEGMINSAKQRLGKNSKKFDFKVVDAQSITFPDESFDIIFAKHMLYHVPNIEKALEEIKRVLKPGGVFYATTNGKEHMVELRDLAKKFKIETELLSNDMIEKFQLSNGESELKKYFKEVKLKRFDGKLVISNEKLIVSYIKSTIEDINSDEVQSKLYELEQWIISELEEKGDIRITTASGMLICR